MIKAKKDLTGLTFGRLTVLYQVEDYISPCGKRSAQWLCECSCEEHNKRIVVGSCLTTGHTTSCGCFSREQAANFCRTKHKTNEYDISGEYGVGKYTNCDDIFLFSLEDFNTIKNYCWSKGAKGYPMAWNPNTKTIMEMHELLGLYWHDHKNRNRSDNRRENLRPSDIKSNSLNRSLYKNNTSGVTGVHWDKRKQMWIAQINVNKKRTQLGAFNNKKDAVVARLQAEQKYYGEFAPQKHLFEQYGIKLEINIITEDEFLKMCGE